jgi:hypothetical protein
MGSALHKMSKSLTNDTAGSQKASSFDTLLAD